MAYSIILKETPNAHDEVPLDIRQFHIQLSAGEACALGVVEHDTDRFAGLGRLLARHRIGLAFDHRNIDGPHPDVVSRMVKERNQHLSIMTGGNAAEPERVSAAGHLHYADNVRADMYPSLLLARCINCKLDFAIGDSKRCVATESHFQRTLIVAYFNVYSRWLIEHSRDTKRSGVVAREGQRSFDREAPSIYCTELHLRLRIIKRGQRKTVDDDKGIAVSVFRMNLETSTNAANGLTNVYVDRRLGCAVCRNDQTRRKNAIFGVLRTDFNGSRLRSRVMHAYSARGAAERV